MLRATGTRMHATPSETTPARRSARAPERLTWAAPDCGLVALGVASADELFAPTRALSPRLEGLAESRGRSRWRFPLPGTPDARGNLTGKPGSLGTGFLWLTVYRGRLRELVRARFTHPRSTSLAEREWNLLCHLRAHGVGTPEPLLVGARGTGLFAAHSFLLVRAPEDAFPLPRWLRTDGIGAERERGLCSVGLTLALLARAGVVLPALRAEHLWLAPSAAGECETHPLEPGGPRKNRLPSVILSEVAGARVRPGLLAGAGRFATLLADLAEGCSADERERLVATALGRQP